MIASLKNLPIAQAGLLGGTSALGDLGSQPLGLAPEPLNDENARRKREAALGDVQSRTQSALGAANDFGLTGSGRKLMPQIDLSTFGRY
jgi:hypothetical protein